MGILRKYGTQKSGCLSRFVPGVHPCSTSPCLLLQQGWASLWSQVGLQMSTPRLIMAYRLIDVYSTYIIIYHDIFIGRYNYYYVLICICYVLLFVVKLNLKKHFWGGPLHDLTPIHFPSCNSRRKIVKNRKPQSLKCGSCSVCILQPRPP